MVSNSARLRLPDEVSRVVLCGGPYNNFAALEKFLAVTTGDAYRFCLGDMGGFGPHPNRTLDIVRASSLRCIQGNYDHAVGHGEPECGCGYIDKLDRHFAQVSFDYTLKNTSDHHRAWLRELPPQMELTWRDKKILLCHGSPFGVSEFVWETETPTEKIASWLTELEVDGICATHSGIPWLREVPGGGFWLNVGVIGRPAHEGKRHVYYATIDLSSNGNLSPAILPLEYDPAPVIREMRSEGLPEEFCRSLDEGIWTTCANILPDAERIIKSRR